MRRAAGLGLAALLIALALLVLLLRLVLAAMPGHADRVKAWAGAAGLSIAAGLLPIRCQLPGIAGESRGAVRRVKANLPR